MSTPDGRSDHELRRYCMGKTINSWISFDSLGHDILYFGGITVVQCFQPICSSVGCRLRVDSGTTRDLGKVLKIVSNGNLMALRKDRDLIYLRLSDMTFLPREKAFGPVGAHISRKLVEVFTSRRC